MKGIAMNERLDYLREKTYLLTTAPGVYQMKDKTGHIIYICLLYTSPSPRD